MFFVYRRESITDVIKAIEFTYDISIDASAIDSDIFYNGTFSSDDDLSKTLEAVFWPLRIDYEIQDVQIVLRPR